MHLPADVTLRDLGSVRLRDLASPEHVYQVVHPQLRQDFPALRSLEATPNNLGQQLTSFVGRDFELTEVRALLGRTRLLTLLGAGGLGKTRLALQVAADVLDDYADGVWFVELAPLGDAGMVPQAVASVLGVKEGPGQLARDALLNFARDRQLLVVLDNCEHLLQPCAELAKLLLEAGPGLKLLATSREPLLAVGEMTYQLPSLSVPHPQQSLAPEALTRYEAVRLFVDRACAAQPAFRLTAQNAMAVVDICRRLDGIPLALELAAARVRALAVGQIDARLSDRFRLLTGGDRTALPRQQTLRACIDWSYDLLTEPERALLRRLAVFAGGWTLEAAEAVGAGGEVDTPEVLDLQTHLVAKSMVEFDAESVRYRLLETVRQYALERLNECAEAGAARTRHLAFYVALAEKAGPHLMGPEQGPWRSRIDPERENLLSAHAWCDHAAGGAALGLRLVAAVQVYWEARGLIGLGHRVTVEALRRAAADEPSLPKCRALVAAGYLGYFMGRYAEAQGHLDDGLVIARNIGSREQVVVALVLLGSVSLAQEDPVAARGHFEEALALARVLGDKQHITDALNSLAELHRAEGDLDTAEPLYAEALALNRERGIRSNIAVNLLNLAMVAIGRGSGDRTRRMLVEALAITDKDGLKREGCAALDIAAGLAVRWAELARAARFYGAAEAQLEQTGIRREPMDAAFLGPLIAQAREASGEMFAASEARGRALTYEEAIAEARAWLECAGGKQPDCCA